MQKNSRFDVTVPALFLVSRLVLIIALPLDGLRGFGDFLHFYHLAALGWPFLDYWVEFPPLFPFISRLIYLLAGGRQHVYDYLLVLILSVAEAACIAVFLRLAKKINPEADWFRCGVVYAFILVGLPYGWWYFDPLAVLAMLLGLLWLINGKDIHTGLALAAGTMVKLFPVMALAVVWRFRTARRAAWVTALTLGMTLMLYGTLWLASPRMTIASVRSQASKGSWETVWALLDGNYQTGNFGPEIERLDPEKALVARGNPARLPSGLTLILFALLGGWFFLKARITEATGVVSFLGFTWCLFLSWSPGFSPQWVLYLIPLCLLGLPEREGILMTVVLTLLSLLEWPVLLTRGYDWGLWITIPARTLMIGVCAYQFWNRGVVYTMLNPSPSRRTT
jgi:hypothetical protein